VGATVLQYLLFVFACDVVYLQYQYMEECVARIKEEFQWNDPTPSNDATPHMLEDM